MRSSCEDEVGSIVCDYRLFLKDSINILPTEAERDFQPIELLIQTVDLILNSRQA